MGSEEQSTLQKEKKGEFHYFRQEEAIFICISGKFLLDLKKTSFSVTLKSSFLRRKFQVFFFFSFFAQLRFPKEFPMLPFFLFPF